MVDGLGEFGIYTFDFDRQPVAVVRESIQELDELGWRAFWFPEVGGREAFSLAGLLLAASRNITIVNGIAQVTVRSARAAHGGAQLLADAYPGRYLLGLGVGQGRADTKPLDLMREYLDELGDLPRILAAYGPKMLALARDRAIGAHTYHVNVDHTRRAREVLGPDAFLAVEHAVLFDEDPVTARATARAHLHTYLTTPFNIAKFKRLGYTDDDIDHGGSDRIVDDLVFWGSLDTIVTRLREHLDAGADHVAIQVIGAQDSLPHWRILADALRGGR
jgi:probable F420-dependent oxidoreductase